MKSKIFVIFIFVLLINFNLEGNNTRQINKIPQLYDNLAKPDTNKNNNSIKKISTSSSIKKEDTKEKTSNSIISEEKEMDERIYSESEDELEDIPDDFLDDDSEDFDDDEE
ncbi:MAG: hypothetical protein LBT51_00920 [Fusobacteriaceae bacterium]|jgi:hypothetical protein|nr:hypothetical protein [Fusobacteriaceae bacterium]